MDKAFTYTPPTTKTELVPDRLKVSIDGIKSLKFDHYSSWTVEGVYGPLEAVKIFHERIGRAIAHAEFVNKAVPGL